MDQEDEFKLYTRKKRSFTTVQWQFEPTVSAPGGRVSVGLLQRWKQKGWVRLVGSKRKGKTTLCTWVAQLPAKKGDDDG